MGHPRSDEEGGSVNAREVLGGGSGGRLYGPVGRDPHVPDSAELPDEFAETRFPILIERLRFATTQAAPGGVAAGLLRQARSALGTAR